MKFKSLLVVGFAGLVCIMATGCASDLSALRQKAEKGDATAQYKMGNAYREGKGVPEDVAEAVKWYRLAAEQGDAKAQFILGLDYVFGVGVPRDSKEAAKWFRLAAEQGNMGAQVLLGHHYYSGDGVPQDYTEAVKWYHLAAEQGDAGAQCKLGNAYREGEGIPQNYVEALMWFRLAAEQGNAEAQFRMGYAYAHGESVVQDYTETVKWYHLAAEQGNAGAQHNLGRAYYLGVGVPQDYAEAVKWYRLAAEQGHAVAQGCMSMVYYAGEGVPQDYAQAYAWLSISASQGAPESVKSLPEIMKQMTAAQIEEGQRLSREYAEKFIPSDQRQETDPMDATTQLCLGIVFARGEGGVPQDFEKAAKWFRLAAEQGNAEAQYNLGLAYALGTGVSQDYTEAAKWFRLSAGQGHAKAQWSLGGAYYLGRGVPQDYPEAIKWYRLAAEQGDVEAQIGMGAAYDQGEAVPQDYTEAAKWYRLAAEQGNAAAQFILGSLYYSGDGVPQDYAQAYAWLSISASQGRQESVESLPDIIKTMTPVQIAEGQRFSREYAEKFGESSGAMDGTGHEDNSLDSLDKKTEFQDQWNVDFKDDNCFMQIVARYDDGPTNAMEHVGLGVYYNLKNKNINYVIFFLPAGVAAEEGLTIRFLNSVSDGDTFDLVPSQDGFLGLPINDCNKEYCASRVHPEIQSEDHSEINLLEELMSREYVWLLFMRNGNAERAMIPIYKFRDEFSKIKESESNIGVSGTSHEP